VAADSNGDHELSYSEVAAAADRFCGSRLLNFKVLAHRDVNDMYAGMAESLKPRSRPRDEL